MSAGVAEIEVSEPPQQRRRYRFIVIAVSVALVVAGGSVAWSFSARYAYAPALQCVCGIGWDPQDGASQVQSQADGHQQTTVKIRPNAQQGFYIWVRNSSRVTQTVLGLPTGYIGPYGGSDYRLEVSTTGLDGSGQDWTHLGYATHGELAPGAERVLRLTWVSPSCFDKGLQTGTDALRIRVRVGAFTRTENIALFQEMALAGTGHCSTP